jgi:hypothetical protein
LGHWFLGRSRLASAELAEAKQAIHKAVELGYRLQCNNEVSAAKKLFGEKECEELMRSVAPGAGGNTP